MIDFCLQCLFRDVATVTVSCATLFSFQICRQAFISIYGITERRVKSIRANVIPDDGRGRHDNRPNKVSEEAKNKVNLLFLTDTTKSAHEYKLRSLYVADIILCLSSCFHAWVTNFLCFLQVREHIKSFPRQTSHYSRKDVPLRRYLSEDLSAQRMHHMYLELHEPAVVERNREILRYLTTPDGFRVGFSRFFFAWI